MREKSIDVSFIIGVLLKNLVFILIAAVIGGVIGYAYTAKTKKPTYSAMVKFSAMVGAEGEEEEVPIVPETPTDEPEENGNGKDDDKDQTEKDVTGLSRNQYAQYLIPTYKVMLTDTPTGRIIAEYIKENDGYKESAPPAPSTAEISGVTYDWLNYISAATVTSAVSFTEIEDTSFFQINITTGNYYLTYAICRAYEEAADKARAELWDVGTIKFFYSVNPYEVAVDYTMPTVLGAAIAAVLVAAIFLLINYLDDTIKTEEDLSSFGALYLGAIPEVETNEKSNPDYGYAYGYGYGRHSSSSKSSSKSGQSGSSSSSGNSSHSRSKSRRS